MRLPIGPHGIVRALTPRQFVRRQGILGDARRILRVEAMGLGTLPEIVDELVAGPDQSAARRD
jgi:hypothetical protein